MLLESEVQDLAEEQPAQAHVLMDHLTQPLQLYQNASQMAENRTSFLSKVRVVSCTFTCGAQRQQQQQQCLLFHRFQIPVCIKEFEDIVYSAFCWLDEAQAWLSAPCSFTTAKSLQNHANSLQVCDHSYRNKNKKCKCILVQFDEVVFFLFFL